MVAFLGLRFTSQYINDKDINLVGRLILSLAFKESKSKKRKRKHLSRLFFIFGREETRFFSSGSCPEGRRFESCLCQPFFVMKYCLSLPSLPRKEGG